MSRFFIDTATGQVATMRQLIEAGLAGGDLHPPERPWHRIQGPDDASTLWYAVLRKQVRGIHIGSLAIRHQPHHASLLQDGWEEVPVDDITVPGGSTAPAAGNGTSTTRR
jgi:hypothetical protein